MIPSTMNVAIGIGAIIIGGGIVIMIAYEGGKAGGSRVMSVTPASQVIHSAQWYVAHPDALKSDEKECEENIGSISEANCENTNSAENIIYANELGQVSQTGK